jgi:hypothetical protein
MYLYLCFVVTDFSTGCCHDEFANLAFLTITSLDGSLHEVLENILDIEKGICTDFIRRKAWVL